MPTRYPRATWVPAHPTNYGGMLRVEDVRLFVIHVAQGSAQSGIDAWFAEEHPTPPGPTSAHFSVSRFGQVHQHVELDRVSYANCAYNPVSWTIEHLGYSGQRLTRVQLSASLNLVSWLHTQAPHVPLRLTANPAGHGVTGHQLLGVEGCDHPSCPGHAILDQYGRALAQRQATATGHP